MTEPAAARRRIYLVRHGETAGQSSIRYHGNNDVPLNDVGRAQVAALVPWLRRIQFAAVAHSPLSRAAESAAILTAGLAHPPPVVAAYRDLREVHFGEIEGMTDGEIRAAMPDWHRRWRAGETDGYPGGDTVAGFRERVVAAFGDARRRFPDGDLLVVAHRGVIRHALDDLVGEAAVDLPGAALGSLSVVWEGPPHQLLVYDEVPPDAPQPASAV